MLDKKFWQSIQANVIARYREHIFDFPGRGENAKDVYGKDYPPFSEYSEDYQIEKKKKGKAFKDSNAPYFTGALFRDFKLRKTDNDGFTFGTTSWGGKVKNLERLGRVISSDKKAIPDKVVDYIVDQAEAYGEKEWKRQGGGKNITIDIKV